MNAVKVDEAHRVRLTVLKPGDYYQPDIGPDASIVTLRRLEPPQKLSKAEVLRRLNSSKLVFARDWPEIRTDTREP